MAAERRFTMLVGLVLAAAAGVYFLTRPDILLGDPDLWWHIQAGHDMIASGHFPAADSYSYTFAGQPWIAKEWLSQVLLALAFQGAGWNGVIFLAAAAAVLAIVLAYGEMARSLSPALAAPVAFAIAVVLPQIVIARPHVFTLPLAVIFTGTVFRAADARRPPPWPLLALVTLWANLHGSFTLAFVIAGIAFVHLVIETRGTNPALLGKWVAFGLLCPVAALVNPYGWVPFQINLDMMAGNESMPLITEWQPFNAGREVIVEYGLLATLALLIGLRARLGWGKVIFILFTLHMFFTHIRFVYAFFLLAPAIAASAIAAAYPRVAASTWAAAARDEVEAFAIRHFRPLAAGLAAAILGTFTAYATANPFAPPPRRAIAGALDYVRAHDLAAGRVFNGYNLGGVLIFNGIKTFIDGRAEQLFRGPFITSFIASGDIGGDKVLRAMLDQWKATWTILPGFDPRNGFLAAMPEWSRAYADDYVVIYVRNAPQ